MGCITCHGGVSGAQDKEAATRAWSASPILTEACAACHTETVAADQNSLHSNLAGYMTVLSARSAPDKMPSSKR